MTPHQLITLDPLARVRVAVGPFPPVRSVGDPAMFQLGLPEGYAYVPIIPRPTDYAPETHTAERHLTEDADGWVIRDLTPEEIEDRKPRPGPVTPRQFWLALLGLGITRSQIRAHLAGNEAALIELEEALEIDPAHPLVASLAAGLGKSAEEVHAIFLSAASL
jgi:hypothetical protein